MLHEWLSASFFCIINACKEADLYYNTAFGKCFKHTFIHSINYPLCIHTVTNPFLCLSSTLFFCLRLRCMQSSESINRSPEQPLFQCFMKCWKKHCSGEQREIKCQCLKKRSSLIESESTSAWSWMSGGVIGDWLQIMNNYIKVARLRAHERASFSVFVYEQVQRCVFALASACQCVCGRHVCARYVLNEEKPAGAVWNSHPASVSRTQSPLLSQPFQTNIQLNIMR